MPSAEELTRHHDPDPDEDPWVHGPPAPTAVAIVAYDPSWPDRYAALAGAVRAALGDVVLDIDHVGSTAVPGLAAKDVIDIDLTVADPTDEAAYVPALEAVGWRHVIREPSWHEHRALSHSDPRANLHVFGPDCPETVRHRMFRDWLRTHPDDLRRYEAAKRAAVPGGGHVMDYNARKQDTVRAIYDRLFRAAGLLPPAHRLVAWERTDESTGHSVARIERLARGWRCHGSEVLAGPSELLSCTFRVELDDDWITREVEVDAFGPGGQRTLTMSADERRRWQVDGRHRPDLDGCVDVDVAATPLTNTFPVRRLRGLGIGQQVTSPIAWVDVPDLGVTRVEQTYRRLPDRDGLEAWEYRDPSHGPFVLTVDTDGVVVTYEEFARRIATAP